MKQWIRFAIGAIIIGLVVLLISVVIDSTRPARADTVSVEKKVTEVGTAMKGWAMAFGGKLEKSGFVQYQKKNFEQAKEQLAENKTQIVDLFSTIGNALNKIIVGGNNVGKNQK